MQKYLSTSRLIWNRSHPGPAKCRYHKRHWYFIWCILCRSQLLPSDLKRFFILNVQISITEKCRIQVNGGRVEYVTQEGKESFYWNIPIANTTAVMLGMGTSVTQMAMREFARAGVMVGFAVQTAHRFIPLTKWILMSSGYARKANIGPLRISRTGSRSGSTKKNGCRRQSSFKWFGFSK